MPQYTQTHLIFLIIHTIYLEMPIPKVAMPPLWGHQPKERKGGFKPIALCALEYLGPLPANRSLLCWQQGLGPEIVLSLQWNKELLGIPRVGSRRTGNSGREGKERVDAICPSATPLSTSCKVTGKHCRADTFLSTSHLTVQVHLIQWRLARGAFLVVSRAT